MPPTDAATRRRRRAVPPFNFTINQINVGHAIDNFFNNGAALPPAFVHPYGLSGSDLANLALAANRASPHQYRGGGAFEATDPKFLN